MNILIVHAHPEEKSFSSALRNTAEDFFKSRGDNVVVSDLYKMNFNPVADKKDFSSLANPDYFIYQNEQLNAVNNNLFLPELKAEIDKFIAADIIIFNFPLWWFSMPAIMKGWIDRIYAMGLIYEPVKGLYETGKFKDKISFCCITTGGHEFAYSQTGAHDDINKIIFHINHGMLYFAGMKVLPQYIVYGPARMSPEDRKSKLESYTQMLSNIQNIKPLY